ncbi:MAG: CPBP family intramembrane glutamic endopeptidase [Brevundimonas sp.]|uniref:CPBP family intramembrane glutamic endopeptidase n=1 Tax=Brevundimonas sp. TaxID=1871086 RepID=UPI0028D65A0A|nr:CPBP family intramembrane glutamic endopeptidase [uncultured Brevundimonas sp.]
MTTGEQRRDYPFQPGTTAALSPIGWAVVMAGCLLGFAALMVIGAAAPGTAGRWLSVLLFVGLPLVALRLAAGRRWMALFPPLTWRDVWIGLAFVPAVLIVSGLVALVVVHSGATTANPIIALLAGMKGWDLALFIVSTLPQLLGEELVTLLPFLGLMALFHGRLGADRRLAVAAAWLISALLFGALHLSTYGWNLAQAFAVIGVARLVLTLPFLITRSVWTSTITHVTHDWLLFGTVLLLAERTNFVGG